MCNDVGEGSRCCFGYSIVGGLFTFWVGIMLSTQPFFIGGIEDVEAARTSAFGAAIMFAFVLVLSCVGMWYDATFGSKKETEIVHAIDDEPASEYQLAGARGPTYGTSS